MKKTLYPLVVTLLFLTQPVLATASNLSQTLVGEWGCTQNFAPEKGINLSVKYIQLFTAQHNFTLDGSMKITFTLEEMRQMFGNSSLDYLFEGSGSWSTQAERLIIKTENAKMTPNNPLAQQMHNAGIMDMNDLQEMQSKDEFIINSLTRDSLTLTHTEEGFTTQCSRTK